MKCQVEFTKTGKYPAICSDYNSKSFYHNEKEMKSYMIGLAISQFLWETHYLIYRFFSEHIKEHSHQIHSYIEIGPGHGLFLHKALDCLNEEARVTVVDISPVSIHIAKSIIKHFRHRQKDIKYHTIDMLQLSLEEAYDFITMGEVLEHVYYPEKLLMKLKQLMSPKGTAFISTCVNGPAIDHVYHFKAVDEIRDMIQVGGLAIEKERILPVEDLPMKEIEEKKITINYCAVLKKQE